MSEEALGRPVPVPDALSAEFWEGARRNELRVQLCGVCGGRQYFGRDLCIHCGSSDVSWVGVSGTGRIYSYTVIRRHSVRWWRERCPYVVALIDLDEGPRVLSNIVDRVEDVNIGGRVRVVFANLTDAIVLPQFEMVAEPFQG